MLETSTTGERHDDILASQDAIRANQERILANQDKILANQAKIAGSQKLLQTIVDTQAKIVANQKKLESGPREPAKIAGNQRSSTSARESEDHGGHQKVVRCSRTRRRSSASADHDLLERARALAACALFSDLAPAW